MVFQSPERLIDLPLPALMGQHQIANAGTAVAAALQLKPLGVGSKAIERGLLGARWPARMQQLNNGPLSHLLTPGSELWLDGGHNVAGGRAIAQTLAELEERAPKPVGLVLGMMGQKDARGFVEQFRGLVRRIVTVPVPGGPESAHEPEKLAALAGWAGFNAEAAGDVETAIRRLQEREGQPLRILICGSLYLAGNVLALQEGVQQQMN
jgi:dihydrofolate synthase/folylpolyglutamate synthase